jgi:hypothetical protein
MRRGQFDPRLTADVRPDRLACHGPRRERQRNNIEMALRTAKGCAMHSRTERRGALEFAMSVLRPIVDGGKLRRTSP